MKNIILLLVLSSFSYFTHAQSKPASKTSTAQKDKSKDNIDDRMKGPKGEKIYIGPNGGRYYLKNGKKIYVEYKGKKKS